MFKHLNAAYHLRDRISEFNNIKNNPGKFDIFCLHNKIVVSHQPHFYETENELWKDKKIREKLIANRIKYLGEKKGKELKVEDLTQRELLSGFKISGIHYGFSHFSPFWTKAFAERFKPKVVYDPCGGWGHRFLGFAACEIEYLYNDIDQRTINGILSISKEIKYPVTVFNNDAASFTPEQNYDTVFTCPPYFNVEKYTSPNSASNLNKTEFINWMEKVIVKSFIEKESCKLIGIVVKDNMIDLIDNIMNKYKINKNCEDIAVGGKNHTSHFKRKDDKVKSGEYLLVYNK